MVPTSMWGEPSRVANWLVVAMTLVTVYFASFPFRAVFLGSGCVSFLLIPILGGLAVCWLYRVYVVGKAGSFHDRNPHWNTNFKSARWLTFPICVVLFATSFGSRPWPLVVRFALSKPAFEQAIEAHRTGNAVPSGWLGLYRVSGITLETRGIGETGYVVLLSYNGWEDIAFCHDESTSRRNRRDIILDEHWYAFRRS